MKTYIICGKSGSGKTTVAEIIKDYYENHKKKAVITGYANYIKLYAHVMLDYDFSEKQKPRSFLQKMGSYIRTDLNLPNMLSDRLLMDMDIFKHFYDVCIISDARLPEEISYLKNNLNNVKVIKVSGNFNPLLNMEQLSHETEVRVDEINNYNYYIENNNDYNSLRAKVYQILEGEE